MSTSTRLLLKDGRPSALEFMRCAVAVADGRSAGTSVTLSSPRLRIGSSPDNDVVLDDETVSRHHAELLVDENGFLLKDLASKNGTFAAGLQVREVYIEPGATFSCGSTHLTLQPSDRRVEIRLSEQDRFGRVLGKSIAMRSIFHLLERTATADVTVLLLGETGTGKDALARSIHDASPRKDGPFVVIDCSALAPEVVESELFGHVKGAFTGAAGDRAGAFEEANGGTVFLDEIGELPLEQQQKLLRVLEAREIRRVGETKARTVNVRVIAATHRSLAEDVAAGRFRRDLFYRLAVLEIRVPALRERLEDVPMLAQAFLEDMAARAGRAVPKLSPNALYTLGTHPWPGNVRELRNVLEKALAFTPSDAIDGGDLVLGSLHEDSPRRNAAGSVDATIPYDEAHDAFERAYLVELLKLHDLKVTEAAKAAGIHRQTIHRLLRKHGIKLDEYR